MVSISKISEVIKNCQDVSVVIFDLDDTLYSEKNYIWSGYGFIAKSFPEIENMQAKLWSAFERKLLAIDTVLQNEGCLDESIKKRCLDIYRNQIPSISLYEGVEEMFQTLLKRGKRLGLITDGRVEGQQNKIKSLRLRQWIQEIIITDELGGLEYRKPNPIAFVEMQKRFNVSFQQMAYVGDNIKKDFIAPKLLGMKSIYFKNKDGLYYEE